MEATCRSRSVTVLAAALVLASVSPLAAQEGDRGTLEELLKTGAEHVALVAEALGVLVVVAGLARVAWEYVRTFPHEHHEHEQIRIRLHLGKSLSLALELLLAADILLTAVAPTWSAIGQLAAIIVLRTLLNYFLHREISREQDELRSNARERARA
jgi:uncharacterized membrane protein